MNRRFAKRFPEEVELIRYLRMQAGYDQTVEQQTLVFEVHPPSKTD